VVIEMGEDLMSECIFMCGRPNGSLEHAWPNWLLREIEPRILPQRRDQYRDEAEILSDCVCDKCNRGFMKSLEDHVHEPLKDMIWGHARTLSKKDTFWLRRWAIKTAAVFEAVHGELVISEDLRERLRKGDSPKGASVLLGWYGGPESASDFTLRHERQMWKHSSGGHKFMSWVTIHMGQVIFYVLTDFNSMHPQTTLTPKASTLVVQLPPGEGVRVEWPSTEFVDEELHQVLRSGPNSEMRTAPQVDPPTYET
jgi:hypothetical protein